MASVEGAGLGDDLNAARELYDASLPKRHRSTQAEMAQFRRAIWDLARRYRPLTGRQLYYRAVVHYLVGKDEGTSRANEQRVSKAVGWMRERYVDYIYDYDGGDLGKARSTAAREEADRGNPDPWAAAYRRLLMMPFDWITDNTRTRYQAQQYSDKDEALRRLHQAYRRNLWLEQPFHIEVWCESDALADVLIDVTDEYGLALLPCRGQSGKKFVFDSAQTYDEIGKPVVVLYVGDFDPSGLDIRKSLHERMIRYGAPEVDFRWLAVTPEQVAAYQLPGHGLNRNLSQPTLRRFYRECDRAGIPREAVEAEAMEPDVLRRILREQIESLIDRRKWELEQEVEAAERSSLGDMLADMDEDGES